MEDLKQIVDAALQINPNCYYYSKYHPVRGATNEQLLSSYKQIGVDSRDCLVPCSSGDQFITASLLGAKSVITYDIDYLTKFYAFLKLGAAKAFRDYATFQAFILPRKETYSSFLKQENLRKVADYLPSEIASFWHMYLKKCNSKQLATFLPCLSKEQEEQLATCTPYYTKEGYESCREQFASMAYPIFVCGDVTELSDAFLPEQFDCIDLSNILECEVVKHLMSFSYPSLFLEAQLESEWISFYKKQFGPLLREDGKMIVDYFLNYFSRKDSDVLFSDDELHSFLLTSLQNGSGILVYEKKRSLKP